ncbi:hypothetical protein EC973_006072 [Apophysomyces ossiformis]|uniref:Nucleoporin nup82 n=1 Tax=Apophysomyces ossiformis TaxID=679940 RepID=A0A8H7ELT3_9FUNG|nr:hypothetical protein EC973_006072 [Apophysomyces ossiformis]
MASALPENWLDYLADHPLFQSTEASKTSQPAEERTRVLALRDHDLLVAVGSHIRTINLNDVKDAWLKAANEKLKGKADQQNVDKSWLYDIPYKALETPEINFTISTLTVNPSGRFLAVTGEHQVVIVVLPRHGLSSEAERISRKQRVVCNTLTVGQTIYDGEKKISVLKVAWHPLSETQSHILILGDDSRLRMFDISADIEAPEQVFDLAPSQRKHDASPLQGIVVTDELDADEEAVSFSIGGPSKDDSGWESFTVYYALRSGHMYALCPVLPLKSTVRRQHLESLSCIAYAKINYAEEKAKKDNEDDPVDIYLYRLQYQWIHDMLESAKKARKEHATLIDGESVSVRSNMCSIPHQIQRQGPFKITQDEDQIMEEGAWVSDMVHIRSKPVDILAVAFSNGTVRNYVLGSGIDAQWLMPNDTTQPWKRELREFLSLAEVLPKATLHEIYDFSLPELKNKQPVQLLSDPKYPDTFYAYHAAGVHTVIMKEWLEKLRKIDALYQQDGQTERGRDALASLNDDEGSKVRCLINSAPFKGGYAPMVGLVVLHDLYLSRCLLGLSHPSSLVSLELGIHRDLAADDTSTLASAVADQLKNITSDQRTANAIDSDYQCMLPLPPFETPSTLKGLQGLPNQPRIVVPSTMAGSKEVVITEESLLFLSDATAKVQRDIKALAQTASSIKKRIGLQEDEFKRQVHALKELYQRVEKYHSTASEREQRIRETAQTHAQLALRADALMRQLLKRYQPGISAHEKAWMEKLENIQKVVEGEHGYAWRLEKLRTEVEQLQSKQLKQRQPPVVTEIKRTSTLTSSQVESIKNTLENQSQLLESTRQRMKKLEKAIQST